MTDRFKPAPDGAKQFRRPKRKTSSPDQASCADPNEVQRLLQILLEAKGASKKEAETLAYDFQTKHGLVKPPRDEKDKQSATETSTQGNNEDNADRKMPPPTTNTEITIFPDNNQAILSRPYNPVEHVTLAGLKLTRGGRVILERAIDILPTHQIFPLVERAIDAAHENGRTKVGPCGPVKEPMRSLEARIRNRGSY